MYRRSSFSIVKSVLYKKIFSKSQVSSGVSREKVPPVVEIEAVWLWHRLNGLLAGIVRIIFGLR